MEGKYSKRTIENAIKYYLEYCMFGEMRETDKNKIIGCLMETEIALSMTIGA